MNKETRDLILELTTTQEMLVSKMLGQGTEYQRLQELAKRFVAATKCIEHIVVNNGPIFVEKSADAKKMHPVAAVATHKMDAEGVAVKKSALRSTANYFMKVYPALMNFANYREIATYFATLFINYSDHDKRDLDIQLFIGLDDKIKWMIFTDGEVIDSGTLIIDKDVPF